MAQEAVIRLVDIHKSFGDLHVLSGISMEVQKGESAVVMGGSGSGKSVLIKHIVKLLTPDKGEVWVGPHRVDEMEGDELDQVRLSIGYVFQSGALFDSMTVEDNLDFFLERHTDKDRATRRARAEEVLEWVGLPEKMKHFPAELSGGQKKRIALARALVLEPDIMLYDEPTTGLDPVSVRSVSEHIVKLREERGITSIAITHDLLCAEIIADQVHFLHNGHFEASGSLEEVSQTDHPEISRFFGQINSGS